MITAGLELDYKNIKIIYSGFQKEDKFCFYVEDDMTKMIYLSLLQFNKAYEIFLYGNIKDYDPDNLETHFL